MEGTDHLKKNLDDIYDKIMDVVVTQWRTPKSWVEPTWGSNYVELRKVGTWGALSTSSTKEG